MIDSIFQIFLFCVEKKHIFVNHYEEYSFRIINV